MRRDGRRECGALNPRWERWTRLLVLLPVVGSFTQWNRWSLAAVLGTGGGCVARAGRGGGLGCHEAGMGGNGGGEVLSSDARECPRDRLFFSGSIPYRLLRLSDPDKLLLTSSKLFTRD